MSKTYSAGIVTAYGAAKRAGYTGTYEDFCRQQAGYAENAAAVEQAKNTAVSAASTATAKAGEATTAATDAQTAKIQTEQAASQALTDIAAARSGAISAVQTEGQAQTANARAQAQAAAQSANTASTKASEASASATSAGQSATNAAASATSAAQSASNAQDVLESIPADYSDLSEDVDDLKADLNNIGVSTETVDFSNYDKINGTIQNSGLWASIETDAYQSALITDIPIKMTVKAKTDKNTYVSFFAQKPSQPTTTYSQIYFCAGETGRHMITMGTEVELTPPSDCKCIIVTVKSGKANYTPTITGVFVKGGILGEFKTVVATNTEDISELKELQNKSSVFTDENRNLCLAGIKTDILTNKIPYHRGFLFHKLQNNDGSLWFGADFRNISKIGSVSFNPNSMRFAISPKDGRIIAVQYATRNGIYVWDGETETHVTGFTLEPMAWLYNSGVDFINDGTDEYCIFAEYKGNTPYDSFNVWRGKYPYTSVSDWEIVLTQTPTDITHFHMIRRDPWTNVLYLTSGDDSEKCKWWYSTDYGATWVLLTTGSTSGYEEHICRCINFVFTKNYIYWAVDKGTNHCLNRVSRDSNGIIDVSSRVKLCDLPLSVATNSICYVESPHGIFMYNRIDFGYTEDYGNPVPMEFWDIDKAELTTPFIIPLIVDDWGGSRGKCYVNYTNGKQTMPAMGFSIETPCIFDLVCDNPSNIGTIAYDVGSKTIHTIDY